MIFIGPVFCLKSFEWTNPLYATHARCCKCCWCGCWL